MSACVSLRRLGAGLFLFILTAALIWAQGSDLGNIRGTVTDASGAVIAKAGVEIVDTATGISQRRETNNEGNYEAFALKAGTYVVKVTMTGFNTVEVRDVVLRSGDTVRADARLQPQGTTAEVLVVSEAPVITTESPTISGTLNNKQLTELPRDSRDIYSFLYLNPNITSAAGDGSFKFIGAQSYGANFTLDGQRSNGSVFGEPTRSQPSLETVGELNVLTNNFSAEYAGVANIRVITKRGTEQFHGSLFWDNRNSALAAWDLRDKIAAGTFLPTPARSQYTKPFFNLNEVGGSFSGPLKFSPRTFFLVSYERRWFAQPAVFSSTTLPHPTLYTGDFSLMQDARKPLVPAGVTLNADEVANNTVGGLGQRFIRIPTRLLNPYTTKLVQTYFPAGNVNSPINPSNGRLLDYYNPQPGLQTRNLGTVRLDHDFSDRDRVYGVYNISSIGEKSAVVVNPFTSLGLTNGSFMNHTLSLSYTKVLSSNLVNEARGGFNQQDWLRQSNTTVRGFLESIGLNQQSIDAYGAVIGTQNLDSFGHPSVNVAGFQALGNGGRNTYRPLNQRSITFGDTVSWLPGRHSFKFGVDGVHNSALDGFTAQRGNVRGLISYTGTGPDAWARFLLGLPANSVAFTTQSRPPMDVSNWEAGFFAQDDWKITQRLTLNLGLRYDLITPFTEANNLLVNFDSSYVGPNGQRGRFVVPSRETLDKIDPRMVAFGVVTAGEIGLPRSLVFTDKKNIAPRLGIAFRLSNRSVLRGGYGFFYPTAAAQGMRDAMASAPFNQGRTKNNTGTSLSPWPTAANPNTSPLSGGNLVSNGSQPAVNEIPFHLRLPRIDQYNVTFEQEIGYQTAVRVSYLGTRMHRLIAGRDLNMLPPSNTPFGTTIGDGVTPCDPYEGNCDYSPADQARLNFPALGDYLASYGNFGHGASNAFQLEVNRRYSKGLLFNFSYTLLDQKSSALDGGNSSLGGPAYNQFAPENDYARDSFVSRHRVVAYGIYELPVGRGRAFGNKWNRVVDAVAGQWQISTQLFAKSGTGFTPYWNCDNCGPAFPGNIASSFVDAYGQFDTSFRPTVVGSDPNLRQGDLIFKADAFGPPPVGANVFDDPKVAKRNFLTGPGSFGTNLGVQKTFRFGERVNANLSAQFNNVFNHPLLSPPDNSIANLGTFNISVDPNTGRILPITDLIRNPNFGRTFVSYPQEGIDSRRSVRLRLRFTF